MTELNCQRVLLFNVGIKAILESATVHQTFF
jgi:hypothetical protein